MRHRGPQVCVGRGPDPVGCATMLLLHRLCHSIALYPCQGKSTGFVIALRYTRVKASQQAALFIGYLATSNACWWYWSVYAAGSAPYVRH